MYIWLHPDVTEADHTLHIQSKTEFSFYSHCSSIDVLHSSRHCCCSSVTQLCPTLCNLLDCSTPGPRPSSSPDVCPSSCPLHQWCHPAISWCPLLLLPSIFPSIRDFPNESAICIRWPKYWSFSFSNSPFNDYSGLISLRIDWFDLLTIQGTLRSLLHHQNSKTSIFWCSAFFKVQLSQPYMTTGNTIALTTQTFVSKIMSLIFNTLSRFVIALLLKSNHLLISWLQSKSADFRACEEKICHYFHFFHFYLPRSNGDRCCDLSFSNI